MCAMRVYTVGYGLGSTVCALRMCVSVYVSFILYTPYTTFLFSDEAFHNSSFSAALAQLTIALCTSSWVSTFFKCTPSHNVHFVPLPISPIEV